MSRRKLLVKRMMKEHGTIPPKPGERVISLRHGPGGEEPSYAIITEPMKRRKRDLWDRWGSLK